MEYKIIFMVHNLHVYLKDSFVPKHDIDPKTELIILVKFLFLAIKFTLSLKRFIYPEIIKAILYLLHGKLIITW